MIYTIVNASPNIPSELEVSWGSIRIMAIIRLRQVLLKYGTKEPTVLLYRNTDWSTWTVRVPSDVRARHEILVTPRK